MTSSVGRVAKSSGEASPIFAFGHGYLAPVDVYSCFPSAVQVAAQELGLDEQLAPELPWIRVGCARQEVSDVVVEEPPRPFDDDGVLHVELRNLATVAELIIRCALERRESRGLHYTVDHPEKLEEAHDTLLPRAPVRPTLAR